MFIFLDDESPEAALPQVAFGFVDLMMMADVTGQQPVNPSAQITRFFRLQDHVEMIGHEAVGKNFHRMNFLGLFHQFKEELIVLFRPENLLPTVPLVGYVVDKSICQSPDDSGQKLLSFGKFSLSLIFWQA